MLVLTRREGEVLLIGNNVAVTVLGIKGNQVRIGIDAPRDVNVAREELLGPAAQAAHREATKVREVPRA